MAELCKNCGSLLDIHGNCPKCGCANSGNVMPPMQTPQPPEAKPLTRKERRAQKKAEKKAAKKAEKKAKRAAMSFGEKAKRFFLKLLAVVLAVAILAAAVTGLLVYYEKVEIPWVSRVFSVVGLKKAEEPKEEEPMTTETTEFDESLLTPYEVTMPDAEAFFQNNSRVLSEIDVVNSDQVHTEEEVCQDFESRGFTAYPITSSYTMDGEYYPDAEISDYSGTKHPIYQTNYVTKGGDIWEILEINGVVMANPLSYNSQSTLGAPVILSESTSVTSYDGTLNKFFETVPSASSLIVKTVQHIDAATLDSLTNGGIDAL